MYDIRKIDTSSFFHASNYGKITLLLGYAILAPSTHNTQPWQFKMGKDYCDIYLDQDKKLPHSDKTDKWLYVSLGCCLENLIIAATYFNVYKSHKYIFNNNHVVRVFFNFDENKSVNKKLESLVNAIRTRQNIRGIFENKPIKNDTVDKLKESINHNSFAKAHFFTERQDIKTIADLTSKGLKIASTNYHFRKELSSWIYHNLSSNQEGMLGHSFRLPLFPSFIFPHLLRYFDMGFLTAKIATKNILSSQIVCVITIKKDNTEYWLESGKAIERIMLELESLGLSCTINIAAIENQSKSVQKLLNTKDIPQFLFAIGYMKSKPSYTRRVNVLDKIISE